MNDEEGLFEMEALPPLQPGDEVSLMTMFGRESCRVVALDEVDGFPLAKVCTPSGDTITVNVAYLDRA